MNHGHDTLRLEKTAARAHQGHATAALIGAIASLAMFGFSVASFIWHSKGRDEHLTEAEKLENENVVG